MKTYHVTLKRESYINYEVEADTPEQAEEKAWVMLEHDDYHKKEDANWECDSVEETQP
jgi:hypothetical protein